MSARERGLGTRAVHGGRPPAANGAPFLAGPTLIGPTHLSGDADPLGYGRTANPTWAAYEQALAELEGAPCLAFASGVAAISAVLLALSEPGDVVVIPEDGYPSVRTIAAEQLEPHGVTVRRVRTDDAAIRSALPGATLVWVETPANPGLETVDLPALAADVHAAGALLAVDNTLLTPYLQRPLEEGADLVVTSGTKALTGHSDVIIGHVAARRALDRDRLQRWRATHGAIPGPFETWLAHRSLGTLGVRLDRQVANAGALAELLREHLAVTGVRTAGRPCPVLCFDLGTRERAEAFLEACDLVADATSFGGLHSSAERRARWGTDAVGEGFIRFSCGVEDPADLVADVAEALDRLP